MKFAARRRRRAGADRGRPGSLIAAADLRSVVAGFGFAIVTLSLVPLTGFAGQISLAQLTFTGIGAVVMATGAPTARPSGWPCRSPCVAVVGAVVALPALRLTGIYLALATAAFGLFCTWMVFNQQDVMTGRHGAGAAARPRSGSPLDSRLQASWCCSPWLFAPSSACSC